MSDIPDDLALRGVPPPIPGISRRGLASCLLLAGALCTPQSQAAARKPARAAPPAVVDFDKLSGARAAGCNAAPAGLGGMGEPSLRRCAWSQHLEMLYWQTIPDVPNSCLPTAALAWQRLHGASGLAGAAPPWSAGWSGHALLAQDKTRQQAGALWRRADGQWSAVLWRWRPSERLATRNWQAGHWNKVVAAVKAVDAGSPLTPVSPLLAAWQDATRGKPRLFAGDAARWSSGGACLDLRTAGIGQSQLHLPYSRDDARLEQRSAMQVQLARRYPDAEWIKPFALLEPATPGARSGAKFVAVWKEGATLQGQLWITLRDDAGIVRARIATDLPAGARADEPLKLRAALVERELAALAHAWEARHE